MNVETFEDLIGWTREMHHQLARCLKHCTGEQQEQRAKWLLEYLADHESALEKTVAEFEHQADPKALHTWLYDYLSHDPIEPGKACNKAYAQMDFEEICREIFRIHNQIIDVYRYLKGRAEIREAAALFDELLDLEEHETMRLAQQSNRLRDM